MQQAALEMGLTAEQGKQLALATFTGAAQLAAQSDDPVAVLRERVTSKGGTTLCGHDQHGSVRREGCHRAGAARGGGAGQGAGRGVRQGLNDRRRGDCRRLAPNTNPNP